MSGQTAQARESQGVSMNSDYDPNSIMSDLTSMLGDDGQAESSDEEPVEESEQGEQEEQEAPEEQGDQEEQAAEEEEEPADEEAGTAAKQVAKGNTEEVEVTDERGRRKITIDYSNKEATKRAYQQAAGARKLYSKYNELKSKYESSTQSSSELKPKAELFDKLSSLYEQGGYRAVVEQLTKKPFAQVVQEHQAEQDRIARMSPEDRYRYERSQLEEENKKIVAQLRAEKEEVIKKVTEEREAAQVAQVQGTFDTLFEQHRFSGQIEDKAQAYRLDKLLFNHVKSELADLEESGVALSKPVIAKVMKEAAEALSFTIEKKANAKATKHVANAKKNATRAAQSALLQGERQVRSGGDSEINWEDERSIANFLHSSMKRK